jgi:hypothetical protein
MIKIKLFVYLQPEKVSKKNKNKMNTTLLKLNNIKPPCDIFFGGGG